LIDVEAAASDAPDRDRPPPCPPKPPPESLALDAFAKFLDAVLKVLFVAAAKVLGAARCSADADGFGGGFGAGAV